MWRRVLIVILLVALGASTACVPSGSPTKWPVSENGLPRFYYFGSST